MPTVGEQLRTAREARKLRVQEVAEATNMRTDHVIALEEGNYAPFPAPVYIRGSVRTYAKLLKLDVMKIMDDLTAEMNQQGGMEEVSVRTGRRRGLLDFVALQMIHFGWKRSLILAGILAVFALILLVRAMLGRGAEDDPLADIPPPTYRPSPNSDNAYLPLPSTNR